MKSKVYLSVITVSRSTWKTKKQINGIATNLFCIGVIGHQKGLSFYKKLKLIKIYEKTIYESAKKGRLGSGVHLRAGKVLAPRQRP